jgi:nucleoside phosphorylase
LYRIYREILKQVQDDDISTSYYNITSIFIAFTLHFIMVIVAALSIEIAPLLNALSAKKVEAYSNKTGLYRGAGHDLLIAGIGPVMAERTLRAYLNGHQPDRILNIGTAGILAPSLELGKIYHISSTLTENEEKIPLHLLSDESTEACLSVRRSIEDSTIRDTSHKKHGAGLADMECYTFALIAKEKNIPMSAMKIATDFADCESTEMFKKQVEESAIKLAREVQNILKITQELS